MRSSAATFERINFVGMMSKSTLQCWFYRFGHVLHLTCSPWRKKAPADDTHRQTAYLPVKARPPFVYSKRLPASPPPVPGGVSLLTTDRQFYFCLSTDTSLRQMPALKPEYEVLAKAVSGRLRGDPSLPLDEEPEEEPPAPEDDEEVTLQPNSSTGRL